MNLEPVTRERMLIDIAHLREKCGCSMTPIFPLILDPFSTNQKQSPDSILFNHLSDYHGVNTKYATLAVSQAGTA